MNLKRIVFLSVIALIATVVSTPTFSIGEKKAAGDSTVARAAFTDSQLAALAQLQAQVGTSLQVSWDPQLGVPTFMTGSLQQLSGDVETGVRQFLTQYRNLFLLTDPASELKLKRKERDELGMTHLRFSQVYRGVPVLDRDLIAHVRSDGMLETINGGSAPSPKVDITPSVSKKEASRIAKADVLSRTPRSRLKTKEKIGILVDGKESHLVWEVSVSSPKDLSIGELIYVDAQSGKIIRRGTTIFSDGPAIGHGLGVLMQDRVLNTFQFGSRYEMCDASRQMYVPPIDSSRGVIVTWDAHNSLDLDSVTATIDPNGDDVWNDSQYLRANVDAHYHVGLAYEFYRLAFNRNSYDNNGATIINIAHWDRGLDNAFWSGQAHVMCYGDGGTVFRPLAAGYDVIVHELSHAVTQSTSNLEYLRQSGAINESMSDVMASVADSNNWTIGEDVTIIPPYFLRSMQDPHQGTSAQPATMLEYVNLPDTVDHGGVHVNSGIPNHAFYYAATGLNRLQAGTIWYRANTVYLSPISQFADLRDACVRSALDLYGGSSIAVTAVNRAFENVLVTTTWGSTTQGYFEGFETNAPSWIAYDADGNGGVTWDTTQVAWYSGRASAVCLYGGLFETQDEWLISEPFQLPQGLNRAILRYETGFSDAGDANDNHYVKIGTSLGNWNGFSTVQTLTPTQIGQIGNTWTGQTIILNGLASGTSYYLAFEYRGTYADNWYVDDVQIALPTSTAPSTPGALPTRTDLIAAYPNPFNPSTTLSIELASASKVRISVFDITGRLVQVVADKQFSQGSYTIRFDGSSLPSGIYFARLEAHGILKTQKLVLLK